MRSLLVGCALVSIPAVAGAQPAGYYDSIDDSSASAMRSTLHAVIDDHTRYPYSSTAVDTWDILEAADEDPNNPARILDLYRNASYAKAGGGNTDYSREHTWPSSYGFPDDNASNYPFTDCHHLFLSDDSYNSARSNKPYRSCASGCTEFATAANNGQGGASVGYPGWSNWTSGSLSSGSWETWIGRRGDVARALLYLDVRYEGGTHGVTGVAEPDLSLTDDPSDIVTGAPHMGMLSELLRWNVDDPVSAVEQSRHEVVYVYQGNRNPFVDHSAWAGCVFRGACPATAAPSPPTGLAAAAGDSACDLDWNDSGSSAVIGYRVFRATSSGGPHASITPLLLAASAHRDAGLTNGTTYFYVARAVDAAGRESASSTEVACTPAQTQAPDAVFINELHYDNDGTDTGERVEIAGPAGTNLSGWRVLGYNGLNGAQYSSIALSGALPDQQGCYGTLSFNFAGLQNGAPDAIALVDASNEVIEFLSYEGAFTAADGPAAGMSSTNIGVAQASSTPIGLSLQRTGTGDSGSEMSWVGPTDDSFGQVNTGQSFLGCGGSGCTSNAQCADGNACNGDEICSGGSCAPGTPLICDDGSSCTDDSCDAGANQCVFIDNGSCGPVCGDGVCAGGALGEDCRSCASDCACISKGCRRGCCGDGACNGSETASSCPVDCG